MAPKKKLVVATTVETDDAGGEAPTEEFNESITAEAKLAFFIVRFERSDHRTLYAHIKLPEI